MHKLKLKKTFFALIFSVITIGLLSFLTYKINLGVFLLASFGSTMVLLFGYPESPFAKPKNIFFGHILTSLIGSSDKETLTVSPIPSIKSEPRPIEVFTDPGTKLPDSVTPKCKG